MDDLEKLKEMRNSFREMADIVDGIIKLQDSSDEDSEKELENLMGRFLLKSMKIKALGEEISDI